MGISPIYNRIIIDLSHADDKENDAFLNVSLPFEQFIIMNYLSDNNSLSLRSISDSPSSKHHNKRIIDAYFQGGEGIITIINGQPTVRRSAGFSAIDIVTSKEYLITSAHTLFNLREPIDIYHAPWYPPFTRRDPLFHFGIVSHIQFNGVDFALIEKQNNDYKLSPMIRSSVVEHPSPPSEIIDDFFESPPPVGHHICISGYDSHTSCGEVTSVDTEYRYPGRRNTVFHSMIRANMPAKYGDIGGPAFSIDNVSHRVTVHGIVTNLNFFRGGGYIVVLQPIRGIVNYGPTMNFTQNLLFIDLKSFGML
ncbi:3574_t:CDS:1 [Gigaspora margarita]|uniref:3574_t:CDS:1 n=1 Tax=Gigaspora margarita TaxID=4874 RepID=A0ABN7UK72_GIGMA|nr:3574_t:CDS:1 [Gigaspora margarita]